MVDIIYERISMRNDYGVMERVARFLERDIERMVMGVRRGYIRDNIPTVEFIMEQLERIANDLGPEYKAAAPMAKDSQKDGSPSLLKGTGLVKRRPLTVTYSADAGHRYDIHTTPELFDWAYNLGKTLEQRLGTVRILVK